MRRGAAFSILLLLGTASAKPGDVVWAKRFGGKGVQYGWGLAVAPGGDVVLGGFGNEPIDLGGGVLLPKATDGIFVVDFDATGKLRWARRFAIDLPFYAGPLGVTRDGKALLAGDFGAFIDLDKHHVVKEQNLYLARVDPRRVDALVMPGSLLGVAGLENGDVAVTGKRPEGGFVSVLDEKLRPRWTTAVPGSGIAVAASGKDLIATVSSDVSFVMKLDASGKVLWKRELGDPSMGGRPVLAVDPEGNAIVALAASPKPLVLTKVDPSGKVLWSQPLKGYNVGGVATDGAGNVVLSTDEGIVKLDPSGARIWTTATTVLPDTTLRSVAVDAKGRVFATGWFVGTFTAGEKSLKAVGDTDLFLICLEP